MTSLLRCATAGDSVGMASVFVAAWKDAYVDVVPEDVLGDLNEAEIARYLEDLVRAGGLGTTVAVDTSGSIIGFARFGPDPDDPQPARGYLAALYVDPASSGRGTGRALLEHALKILEADGRIDVTLWVFRENARARHLYERSGFCTDGTETVDPRWRTRQVRYRRRRPLERES